MTDGEVTSVAHVTNRSGVCVLHVDRYPRGNRVRVIRCQANRRNMTKITTPLYQRHWNREVMEILLEIHTLTRMCYVRISFLTRGHIMSPNFRKSIFQLKIYNIPLREFNQCLTQISSTSALTHTEAVSHFS